MSAKDAHLYSIPHAKRKTAGGHEISSSGSLAFTSQLSSLISSGKSHNERAGAGRAHKQKEDIFTTHNRNAHKRAKKDLEADGAQKHTTSGESLDSATWHRSKRKMEDKARLYAAMKRGDVEDEEGRHMVDFDRKWAEREEKGQDNRWENESSEGSEAEPEVEEQVQWTDEFGRTRTGTKSQMLRAQQGLRMAEELDTRARPAAPTQIIYGDAVQSAAFNPESTIAERMAELASKRDKSLTPPPDTHFDSSKEVRHKGVGFMQLSLDAQERKKQMEELERDRQETENKRGERERKLKERREMLDKRRHEIEVKRTKRKADEFLEELSREIAEREAHSSKADDNI